MSEYNTYHPGSLVRFVGVLYSFALTITTKLYIL